MLLLGKKLEQCKAEANEVVSLGEEVLLAIENTRQAGNTTALIKSGAPIVTINRKTEESIKHLAKNKDYPTYSIRNLYSKAAGTQPFVMDNAAIWHLVSRLTEQVRKIPDLVFSLKYLEEKHQQMEIERDRLKGQLSWSLNEAVMLKRKIHGLEEEIRDRTR